MYSANTSVDDEATAQIHHVLLGRWWES